MANKLAQYLEEIRALGGLKNAILCGISVYKRGGIAEFFLVTDKTYTAMEEKQAQAISQKYLPSGFSAQVRIVKRVPDAAIIKNKIYDYIKRSFPAATAFLEEKNIEVEMLQSGAHFYVDIASGEQSLFSSGKILDETSAYLGSIFCGAFYGNVRIVEKERDESVLDELPEETHEETIPIEIRQFPICDYGKIDGMDEYITKAIYMADCLNAEGTYAI